MIWDQKDQKVLAFLSFPSVFSPVGHKCSGVSDKGNHIVTDRYRVSSMGMDTHTGGGGNPTSPRTKNTTRIVMGFRG